ncbi:hypothetical protein VNO80_05515 [Phaseolus coccineus]|uniref:Uncharacterized protein n=1 Tax=Phaseolus coccineus TaxID=3886 RepID=A0AAN9NG44_PHACN
MTPFNQSIGVDETYLKEIRGVIYCLIYTGFQYEKASFHNGRSITAAVISLQYFPEEWNDILAALSNV